MPVEDLASADQGDGTVTVRDLIRGGGDERTIAVLLIERTGRRPLIIHSFAWAGLVGVPGASSSR